ncbi:MAG: transglutaminase domain-containing protein [Bacteroidota bacterium]|nr:transglutaminase domain-containing protein [Bacteroidota bacterium]
MFRKIILVVAVILIVFQNANAQSNINIEEFVKSIPESKTKTSADLGNYIKKNLKTEDECIRAFYSWLAFNVNYDVEKMYHPDVFSSPALLIEHTLKTRKAVCQGYSELFNDLCKTAGIKSFVIQGYTKQNGVIVNLGHAWIAVKLKNNEWTFIDPTWGAGYVMNNEYIKRYNDDHYRIKPENFIKTHMPFDPMWQLMDYPVTNKEFYDGKTISIENKQFNYNDSISKYETQSELDKYFYTAQRVEKNGVINQMTSDYLNYLNKNIAVIKQNQIVFYQNKMAILFNSASSQYRNCINLFNEYITFKYKQGKPKKTSKEFIAMLNKCKTQLTETKSILLTVDIENNDNLKMNLNQINKSISDFQKKLDEEYNKNL